MVMTRFRDYVSKIRHYFRFSKEEIEACVISVLVMAFIISFDEWGYSNAFDFNVGLGNFISAIIIASMVFGFQIAVIKFMALLWGYRAEFKLWWYGVIIGLGLCFLSGSFSNDVAGASVIVWFLTPGGVFFHHMPAQRFGWFRYGVNMTETGICCMLGSISNVLLAIIFKILLNFFPESAFLYKAMIVSLWFAFFTMLPIPPLNGSRVFFWSRITYPVVMGGIIGANVLLRTPLNIFLTILISFIFGMILWFINLRKVEGRI
jgi:hypothetical protein